jgi:hypothetical protein
VFDYYKDIVTEIKLQALVDGSDVVGDSQPFGVFVNLLHTREIERESGGFARYLQNQNNVMYSYNYGRPTENYRDKFQEAARQSLGEHFEVMSVTFESDTVHSRASDQYGWRVTPYAYLLLKARGPQIDKIPPMRLDLDFLDTSGYVVLPIESPAVPVDCGSKAAEPRPVANVEITQILDERQSDKGKLILEVKATGLGLLPDLDQLVDLAPAGFTKQKSEDTGVAVSRFSADSAKSAVVCERTWMVTFKARDDLEKRPETFQFGQGKLADAKLVFQKYVDADLKNVDATTPLGEKYGEQKQNWVWTAVVVVALLLLAGVLLRFLGGGGSKAPATALKMPEHVTPFTVLGLLRAIHEQPSLDEVQRQELRASIQRLEAHYFSPTAGDALDLQSLAKGWLERTVARRAAG